MDVSARILDLHLRRAKYFEDPGPDRVNVWASDLHMIQPRYLFDLDRVCLNFHVMGFEVVSPWVMHTHIQLKPSKKDDWATWTYDYREKTLYLGYMCSEGFFHSEIPGNHVFGDLVWEMHGSTDAAVHYICSRFMGFVDQMIEEGLRSQADQLAQEVQESNRLINSVNKLFGLLD